MTPPHPIQLPIVRALSAAALAVATVAGASAAVGGPAVAARSSPAAVSMAADTLTQPGGLRLEPAAAEPLPSPPGEATGPAPTDEIVFPVTLGSFSTTLIGSLPERTANVRLAAAALDGAVLAPGDEWSFNRHVGPRSRARGYQDAPVILRETRQLQTGGGVCQVASTVFAAALLAGLSVAERHRHSSPVDYIPLGEDATIAWGVKDLRLRNDLPQRVRLRVEVVGSLLSARLEGEDPVADSYDLETVEREIPGDPGVGSAAGREVELFRVRKSDGEVVSRDFVHRDVYAPARARAPR